jgi:Flp pilus assembly protein TadG
MMRFFRRLRRDDRGNATLEFVIAFPVFFMMFLMSFESGMISLRHFSLERGVDIVVRELRIGALVNPTRAQIQDRICQEATLIPDCANQLVLELVRRDPRSWVALSPNVACVNRGDPGDLVIQFSNGSNNDLMVLRACVRFDPYLPTTGLGRAIVAANDNDSAQGSYALVTTTAYVVEPF